MTRLFDGTVDPWLSGAPNAGSGALQASNAGVVLCSDAERNRQHPSGLPRHAVAMATQERPTSPGECLFAAHLRQRRLGWDFEAPVGGRAPDFTVRHPAGDIVCEVYEPEIRLPPQGGAFSSYPALRSLFEARKRKQAKAASGAGHRFMYVVGRANSDIEIDPSIMAGAMLGDLGVTFPAFVDGDEPPGFDPGEHARSVFGSNRRLQPAMNTSVSAVAIVRSFNPTLWRFELASRERFRGYGPVRDLRDAYQRAVVREEIATSMDDAGAIDLAAARARLIVLHNPFASSPISLDAFGGPHDEQWGSTEPGPGRLEYGPIAQGRWSCEIPGILGGEDD
jgi:hypothetical protein